MINVAHAVWSASLYTLIPCTCVLVLQTVDSYNVWIYVLETVWQTETEWLIDASVLCSP